jgi:hypothetical protein
MLDHLVWLANFSIIFYVCSVSVTLSPNNCILLILLQPIDTIKSMQVAMDEASDDLT